MESCDAIARSARASCTVQPHPLPCHGLARRTVLSELRLASGGHPLGITRDSNAHLHPFQVFGDEVIVVPFPAIRSRRFASTMEEMLAAPPAVETPHPALVPLSGDRSNCHRGAKDSPAICAISFPQRKSLLSNSAPPQPHSGPTFCKASASVGGLRSIRRMPPDRVRTAARPQPLCRLAAARRGATGVRTFRRDLLPTIGISAAGRYPQSVERSSAESRSGLLAPADYFRSAGSRQ